MCIYIHVIYILVYIHIHVVYSYISYVFKLLVINIYTDAINYFLLLLVQEAFHGCGIGASTMSQIHLKRMSQIHLTRMLGIHESFNFPIRGGHNSHSNGFTFPLAVASHFE